MFQRAELNGNISAAAFNFIVQEPSAIIEWFNARSFLSNDLIYLIIEVSEWYELNTFSSRKLDFRLSAWGMELKLIFEISKSISLSVTEDKTSIILLISSISVASFKDIENSLLFMKLKFNLFWRAASLTFSTGYLKCKVSK